MKPQLALANIYRKLYTAFGPQHWWPGDSPFEVMVGAILTQGTSWQNVEKAIANLKKSRLLAPKKLYGSSHKVLAREILPAGYYNIKARRLKNFLEFFLKEYSGSIKKMQRANPEILRRKLLAVNGIGPETADSILLYALNKPVFVVDAYTKRIFARHRLVPEDTDYSQMQDLFMQNLKPKAKLFNEYHALLVRVGKEYCLKNKPRCQLCPLK